jgi:hypothetical protein
MMQHSAASNPGETTMYAIIKDVNGKEKRRYDVPDVGALDPEIYAHQWCKEIGVSLSSEDGWVPSGGEEFSVTLTEDPHAVRCWSFTGFMYAREV